MNSILLGRRPKKAFTLVELLVVIAIIGILIGMLLPAVQQVREAARRVNCANNIRQLAVASHNYESTFQKLPPGLYQNQDASSIRYYGSTWLTTILPQMEQSNLHDLWDFTDSGAAAVTNGLDAAGNPTADAPSATPIATFLCPSDQYNSSVVELTYTGSGYPTGFFGLTSYLGSAGTYSTYFNSSAMQDDGVFFMTGPNSGQPWQSNLQPNARPAEMVVQDGTSNTFMFGERYHEDKNFEAIVRGGSNSTQYSRYAIDEWGTWGWYGGGNGTTHVLGSTQMPLNYRTPETASAGYTEVNNRMSAFGSGHPAGANFALMDGSVQYIGNSIDFVTYQALSTRKGGEIVSPY